MSAVLWLIAGFNFGFYGREIMAQQPGWQFHLISAFIPLLIGCFLK
jgi:hypothetical protein